MGRDDLVKALRREGLPAQRVLKDKLLDEIVEQLNYNDHDALFAAIGEGHQSAGSVAGRFARTLHGHDEETGDAGKDQLPTTVIRRLGRRRSRSNAGVHVEGLDDIMIRLSRCCSPVPPDEIMGFVTRGRGVSVHRADCLNAIELSEGQPDRLIEVEWDADHSGFFSTSVEVHALDRAGLLRDVTAVLWEHNLSILSAVTDTGDDRIAKMQFEFELADVSQLDSVLSSILGVEAVFDAYRIVPGSSRNK